ncbi:MAG: hypothetical protein IJL72_07615 [Lachnospiraceae bacterium]|nr:hypothetical protein [Lachnospiraceae bacterium]
MLAKDFNYDRYHKVFDPMQENLRKFVRGDWKGPLFMQDACGKVYAELANHKETSLEAQLDLLTEKMDLHGDYLVSYLEPWCGVGVYANAFGAKLRYYNHSAVQTLPVYASVEEVENVPLPKLGECELMQAVADYIRYFREQTHDQIPIVLTDTQSPNDTASLILDPVELFMAAVDDMESIDDFMMKVTKTIGDFTELQMELIGEKNLARPGHTFPSDITLPGISLSDDNLAVLSPKCWVDSARKYNDILARRFGGIALHSCGVFTNSIPDLVRSDGMWMVNYKISDFEPNDAAALANAFAGTGTIQLVTIFPGEDLTRLLPLIRDDLRVIFVVGAAGEVAERNDQYDRIVDFFRSAAK